MHVGITFGNNSGRGAAWRATWVHMMPVDTLLRLFYAPKCFYLNNLCSYKYFCLLGVGIKQHNLLKSNRRGKTIAL